MEPATTARLPEVSLVRLSLLAKFTNALSMAQEEYQKPPSSPEAGQTQPINDLWYQHNTPAI
jgi:hypothetical protein